VTALPILLSRGGDKIMVEFKRILVPLDGSPLAERALPLVTALALRLESQIILLRALEIPTSPLPTYYPKCARDQMFDVCEKVRQDAENYLKDLEVELRQQGIDVRILLPDPPPAESIIDAAAAEDVDLIAISTHGRSGLARWTFGSVAEEVARHSPCPVLLIRKRDQTEG
jgi:nucleotide-binding universal stress UspA family protein